MHIPLQAPKALVEKYRKKAQAITAASQWLATQIAPWINKKRLHVMPFGVDTSLFDPARFPPRQVMDKGCRILFAKRLMAVSGADQIIAIAQSVITAMPDARFTLAGTGPLEGTLKDEALQSGMDIRFAGAVANKNIPELRKFIQTGFS